MLNKIVKITGEEASPPIGALTCDNRDIWAANRDEILNASPKNAALLRKLESAAFLLCLDDGRPVTKDEVSRACWHGDGENRWFDKSLQFIVFENGKAGFCGEHSLMDATPTARMCDFVVTQSRLPRKAQEASVTINCLPEPICLDFHIPPSIIKEAIPAVLEAFNALQNRHDLRVLCYRGYGKNFIKTVKVSPDAYCQMAIQLAWYKMRGTWVSTYESAGMRGYSWGRTETCRSVSDESVEFVIAMESAELPVTAKAQLARRAIAAQSAYMAGCLKGQGIDRHLLGLRLSLQPGEPTPAIFVDHAYTLTSHWTLSTSQIPSELFEGYGWGEVVPDGFGVAYMVKGDSLRFNVTGQVGETVSAPLIGSKPSARVRKEGIPGGGAYEDLPRNRVRWFKHYLEESLEDLRQMFHEAAAIEAKQAVKNEVSTPHEEAPKLLDRVGRMSIHLPPRRGLSVSSFNTPGLNSPAGEIAGAISRDEPGLSLAYPKRRSLANLLSPNDDAETDDGVLSRLGSVDFDVTWKREAAKNYAKRMMTYIFGGGSFSSLSTADTSSNSNVSVNSGTSHSSSLASPAKNKETSGSS